MDGLRASKLDMDLGIVGSSPPMSYFEPLGTVNISASYEFDTAARFAS